MKSKLLGRASATETTAQGSRKRVLVNTSLDEAILIFEEIDNNLLLELIDQFECRLFTTVKALLKAPRQEVMYLKNSTCSHPLQPYFFSGNSILDKGPSGNRRHVFDIANSKLLRSAANLTGTGTRDADYATYSNASLLELPLDEKHSIIDKALGLNWADLQKALKPSARKYGLVLPNLRNLLHELRTPQQFLSQVISLASTKNLTGEVSRRQTEFLLWSFLGYLRSRNVLLLPVQSHYVEFVALDQRDFFRQIFFSQDQLEILARLEVVAKKYQHQNRRKLIRIVQTVFLSSQVDDAGAISPEIFIAINEAILSTSSSITYQEKTTTLARTAYDFMAGFWNDKAPESPIPQPVGAGFRIVEQRPPVSG